MVIFVESSKEVDELVISYIFPPITGINGIVVGKRVINNKSKIDVIHNLINEDFQAYNFNIVDEYVNDRIQLEIDSKHDTIDCIFNYIKYGIEAIENKKEYKKIFSSSFLMANHYLAWEYKFRHPDVYWKAEFSDPIMRSLYTGKPKKDKISILNDQSYIDKLNAEITKLNERNNTDFKLLENPNSTYYIAEYMTFLFADVIMFPNENQREMMLECYGDDIKEIVMEKSIISPHQSLEEKYYHCIESDVDLNEDDVNIAYFGSYYYSLRHFEPLFYAFESLNHKFKDKIKFHLYIPDDELIKALVRDLEFKDYIIIKKPLDYLEFLNATTKYDVLLINDTITAGKFRLNPYLPSKYSDYAGSGRDIWALYEDKSILSGLDLKYKSSMTDYVQSCDVLANILKDNGYDDPDYTFDEHLFEKRITQLNNVSKREFDKKVKYRDETKDLKRQIRKLKKEKEKIKEKNEKIKDENQRIKDENKEIKAELKSILNSNSWKITKPLRSVKNFRKK